MPKNGEWIKCYHCGREGWVIAFRPLKAKGRSVKVDAGLSVKEKAEIKRRQYQWRIGHKLGTTKRRSEATGTMIEVGVLVDGCGFDGKKIGYDHDHDHDHENRGQETEERNKPCQQRQLPRRLQRKRPQQNPLPKRLQRKKKRRKQAQ